MTPLALLALLLADGPSDRDRTLAAMQQVMGPLPDPVRAVPLDVRVDEEVDVGTHVRRKLTFAAEPGDRVPAYLLVPKRADGRLPAVLCLHQTTEHGKAEPAGLAGLPNLFYARELAERGYVTLAPDYPGFGDSRTDPYALGYASGTMKGVWNHRRAVDLLQSLPEVAPDRIGVLGHSLGGHNALFAAAFDDRLRVAVTSCGFTSFPAYRGGDLTGWTHKGYMPRIAAVYGNDPRRLPFDFPDVLAAIAPRAVFVSAPERDDNFAADGVRDCLKLAKPAFDRLGAGDRLAAVHPDGGHDFPPAARELAYRVIDRAVGKK
jgi:dienelactone hydrolase